MSILIPDGGAISEKVLVPVPFEAVKAVDFLRTPVVVVTTEPPATVIGEFT